MDCSVSVLIILGLLLVFSCIIALSRKPLAKKDDECPFCERKGTLVEDDTYGGRCCTYCNRYSP